MTYEAIQNALDAIRRAILSAEIESKDIAELERIAFQLREIQAHYRAPR